MSAAAVSVAAGGAQALPAGPAAAAEAVISTAATAAASAPAVAAAKPVDVAVGILIAPNGDVLLGQRPAGKPYEGYWEFPGGKVDPGETVLQALKREFMEELGMVVESAQEWCGVEYVYPHAHVRLHFFISRDWHGEAQSLEGQAFAWQGAVGVEPLLPATIPLLEWLEQIRHDPAALPA